tara:strand:- start:322 stop:477 length:156 start_codon:yes stop_codon:yes gene_type:complete
MLVHELDLKVKNKHVSKILVSQTRSHLTKKTSPCVGETVIVGSSVGVAVGS